MIQVLDEARNDGGMLARYLGMVTGWRYGRTYTCWENSHEGLHGVSCRRMWNAVEVTNSVGSREAGMCGSRILGGVRRLGWH